MVQSESHPNGAGKGSEETLIASETTLREAELDISQVSQLVEENSSLLGGEDVAELLERLTSADTVAQGVESKLDSVLSDLDNLLSILGKEEEGAEQEGVSDPSRGHNSGNIGNGVEEKREG